MRSLFSKRPATAPWRPAILEPQRIERLLDQQFWCFGRDIAQGPENLLVRYGLNRYPRRDSTDGSGYANRTRCGTILALWGFGVYLSEGTGILLRRDSLVTWIVDDPQWPLQDWTPETFPKRAAAPDDYAAALALLAKLFRWFANYESWVQSTRPASYGVDSLNGWHRVVMPRGEMANAWREHARELGDLSLKGLAVESVQQEAACLP